MLTIDWDRVEKSEKLVYDSYKESSIIEEIVKVRSAKETDKNFETFHIRRLIPKEWFIRKDISSDLVFTQFGSNIALSEKKYILKKIFENNAIPKGSIKEIKETDIIETIVQLYSSGNKPDAIFIPISFFRKFFLDWRKQFQMKEPNKLTVAGFDFKIFWSNKYTPFNEFIFINKDFGQWISKPSVEKRLFVEIKESEEPDKLELEIISNLKFLIINPEKILILKEIKDKKAV